MTKILDLTNHKYGMLTVKRITDMRSGSSYKWICLCECGGFACVASNSLRTGHTDNCGCLTFSRKSTIAKTHGHSGTPVHKVWIAMKRRCFDPKSTGYHSYGGRGITVQDTWANDFMEFYNYIGEKPAPDFSLDRIDNNGNYCEGNVKWSSTESQTRNKSMYLNNNTGITGVNLVKKKNNWYYIAIWESKGKQHNKVFSVNKHGLLPAMAKAVATRQSKLEQLRLYEGYSEGHGEIRKIKEKLT